MEDHQFQVLIERLDALADIGEKLVEAVTLLADPHREMAEEDETEDPKPTTMLLRGQTLPELDKPLVHFDIMRGGEHGVDPDKMVILFEEGAPKTLQEFVLAMIQERHVGYKMDQFRVSQIETDVTLILMDFAQCGITLRIPPFDERHWEFSLYEAEKRQEQKRLILTIPSLGKGT